MENRINTKAKGDAKKLEKAFPYKSFFAKKAEHIKKALELAGEFKVLQEIDSIVFAGTGVNWAAAELLKGFLSGNTRVKSVDVVSGFELPNYAGLNTLVFVLSYSGNEPESLACYRAALRRGCKTIVLTSKDRLLDSVLRTNTEHIRLPEGLLFPFCYLFFIVLRILENSKIIGMQDQNIEDTLKALKGPSLAELGQSLGENLNGKHIFVYGSKAYYEAAIAWKACFNLIAGIPCFSSLLPGAAYCDLAGFSASHEKSHFVILRDEKESREIAKSIAAFKKTLKSSGYPTTEIAVKGTNRLAKLISALSIAEWAAVELHDSYKKDASVAVQEYLEAFRSS